ncbi:MAG: hypothetical protein ACKVPJ_01055 [Chitinophagales bacterium]
MTKNKAWALVMLGLIIILPFISWYVMKEGEELRRSNTASELYNVSSIRIPDYNLISQRADTISNQNMQNKVCVYEFYSEDCYAGRYEGRHKLFELQEDYYGKTTAFRIISVNLSDTSVQNRDLWQYSILYAAREIWHVTGGDTSVSKNIFEACEKYLTERNRIEQNLNCPSYVFIADRKGYLCGAYNIKDEKEYSSLFTDILYTIDRKE